MYVLQYSLSNLTCSFKRFLIQLQHCVKNWFLALNCVPQMIVPKGHCLMLIKESSKIENRENLNQFETDSSIKTMSLWLVNVLVFEVFCYTHSQILSFLSCIEEKETGLQGSISSTFYLQFFCTKIFSAAFL